MRLTLVKLLSKGTNILRSCRLGIELEKCQLLVGSKVLLDSPLAAFFGPGELNIVAGPNGCGKTSLLDVLAMRAKPAKGSHIFRKGHSKPTDIAYLPQAVVHLGDVTVRDLVLLAFRNSGAPTGAPSQIGRILGNTKRECGDLSGGERQILLFWLVASQQAQVFVYDEPFRHLDEASANVVTRTIEHQVRCGELVIISEHSEVARWEVPTRRLDLTKGTTVN